MKLRWVIAAVCILAVRAVPQGHYPLQAGNVWQYYETPPPGYYGWTARAIHDTLMPNGQSFRIISQDIGLPEYLRQSGSRVYGWELVRRGGGAYEEVLLYDFSKRPGDTVVVYYSGGDTIITLVTDFRVGTFYGIPRVYWRFVTDSRPHRLLIVRDVIDTVGLVYVEYEGMGWFMRGCIIDGVQYGIITHVQSPSPLRPGEFSLFQNFPNPFNPTTCITYELPKAGMVRLSVFDVLGRHVATLLNGKQEAGQRSVIFQGSDLPSGTYFYRLETDGMTQTRKMSLTR
ncbi:MAG: T9SS type A sorting domain-containing protein [Bacteroidota bacterium]